VQWLGGCRAGNAEWPNLGAQIRDYLTKHTPTAQYQQMLMARARSPRANHTAWPREIARSYKPMATDAMVANLAGGYSLDGKVAYSKVLTGTKPAPSTVATSTKMVPLSTAARMVASLSEFKFSSMENSIIVGRRYTGGGTVGTATVSAIAAVTAAANTTSSATSPRPPAPALTGTATTNTRVPDTPTGKGPAAGKTAEEEMQDWVRDEGNANTRKAYLSAWNGFQRWLESQESQGAKDDSTIQATELAQYLKTRLESGVAASTIANDRAAVAERLKFKPNAGIVNTALVTAAMKVCRTKAPQSVPKRAASAGLMLALVEEFTVTDKCGDASGWLAERNLCLLLTMFYGLLREAEAVGLRRSDVSFMPMADGTAYHGDTVCRHTEYGVHGAAAAAASNYDRFVSGGGGGFSAPPESLRLWIGRSKTDQAGKGREVLVSPNLLHKEACLVWRLKQYMARKPASADSVLFPTQGGAPLSRTTPCGIVQRAVTGANHWTATHTGGPTNQPWGEPDEYGSHSMRRGGATAAKEAGTDMEMVRQHGRWAPGSMAALGYLEPSKETKLGVTSNMLSPAKKKTVTSNITTPSTPETPRATIDSPLRAVGSDEANSVAAKKAHLNSLPLPIGETEYQVRALRFWKQHPGGGTDDITRLRDTAVRRAQGLPALSRGELLEEKRLFGAKGRLVRQYNGTSGPGESSDDLECSVPSTWLKAAAVVDAELAAAVEEKSKAARRVRKKAKVGEGGGAARRSEGDSSDEDSSSSPDSEAAILEDQEMESWQQGYQQEPEEASQDGTQVGEGDADGAASAAEQQPEQPADEEAVEAAAHIENTARKGAAHSRAAVGQPSGRATRASTTNAKRKRSGVAR